MTDRDTRYLEIVLDCVRVCAQYKPKFGKGKTDGLTLEKFQELYREDPFYSWFGLYNPRMYAAHKTAGGITSVYRQIGLGCEKLFREILLDELSLSEDEVSWSHYVETETGKKRRLSLDGRVLLNGIGEKAAKLRFKKWMCESAQKLGIKTSVVRGLSGAVFEVRQGYKSKDSKRQNADIANASAAYTQSYLPCVVVLSNQIDTDILTRYKAAKWVILTGKIGENNSLVSTYDFMREIIGYDLAMFFERNAHKLRNEIDKTLQILLTSEES